MPPDPDAPQPTTFRDSIGRLGPPWTQNEWGAKLKYAYGVLLDAVADAVKDGLLSRFPGQNSEALPHIGNDRQIIRGLSESDESYARRLSQAWDTWKKAGSSVTVALQLLSYFGTFPQMRIVSTCKDVNSGQLITNWITFDAGTGAVTFLQVQPGNWNWDNLHDPNWSRFWIIIYTGGVGFDTWGNGIRYGQGRTWGTVIDVNQIYAMRSIIQQFKAAHSLAGGKVTRGGGGVILAGSGGMFDPAAAPGAAGMPDGTWGNWSKNVAGVQVRARATGAAYLDGML